MGRERTNDCDLADDLSLERRRLDGLESLLRHRPPFQPQVKGQIALPVAVRASWPAGPSRACPGRQQSANYPLSNAIVLPSLGRPFTNTPPTVAIVPAGTMYGDRIYQTDVRFRKTIKSGRTTIRPTISIYNLFNANPVQTYNNTYGAAWLAPTVILTPRFMDFGVQIDF